MSSTPRDPAATGDGIAAGSWRSPLVALLSLPFLAISTARYLPAAQGTDFGTLAVVPVLAETAAFLIAILAIFLGDETTQRGRLGRRTGMVVVMFAVGVRLAGGALAP